MYVAKIQGEYYLKRMPGTGHAHDPSCDSFAMPPELSGLGQVEGKAITTDDSGETTLKLDFPLSVRGRRGLHGRSVRDTRGWGPLTWVRTRSA